MTRGLHPRGEWSFAFSFDSERVADDFERYVGHLADSHPSYVFGDKPGRDYLLIWHRPTGSSTKSAVAFVDSAGNLYRADSWKKRGRRIGNVSSAGVHVRGVARDRHRHRTKGAPTFAQQRFIGRKIRKLHREGYEGKQAVAIAYRYAGVPPRKASKSTRRRSRRHRP